MKTRYEVSLRPETALLVTEICREHKLTRADFISAAADLAVDYYMMHGTTESKAKWLRALATMHAGGAE